MIDLRLKNPIFSQARHARDKYVGSNSIAGDGCKYFLEFLRFHKTIRRVDIFYYTRVIKAMYGQTGGYANDFSCDTLMPVISCADEKIIFVPL